jgi:hypothetical protein
MSTCNVQSLLKNAACFNCLSPGEWDIVELQLLCEILSAGGGSASNGITCANYGGGTPSFVPASGCGMALDTSNNVVWYYYSGLWHSNVAPIGQLPQTLWAAAFAGNNFGVPHGSILDIASAYGSLVLPANFFALGKTLYFTTQALNLAGDIGPFVASLVLTGNITVQLDFAPTFCVNGGGVKFEAWIYGQQAPAAGAAVRAILRAYGENTLDVTTSMGPQLTHSEVYNFNINTNTSINLDAIDDGTSGLDYNNTYFMLI